MQSGQAADETRGWTSPERRARRQMRGSAESAYAEFGVAGVVDGVCRVGPLGRSITQSPIRW